MIKVGVIRGGINSQYENSLETGENILFHLRQEKLSKKYKPIDILIDKNGIWYMNGLPINFEKLFYSVDVIFNALHGDSDKQSNIHQIFNQWKILYTSSSSFPSAITTNKVLSKEHLYKLGVKVPKHILFSAFQDNFDGPKESYPMRKAQDVFKQMSPPYLVKPLDQKTSMGTHVCKTLVDLVHAFKDGMDNDTSLLVEELIEGDKASVSIIKNFRNEKLYSFPPIGNLSKKEKEDLERISKLIHSHFNFDNYSQISFVVKRYLNKKPSEIYVTTVRHLPDMSSDSRMSKHLESVGSNMYELIDHIITQTINK